MILFGSNKVYFRLILKSIWPRSCLGPLLFLIYINDLPRAVQSSTESMHADDTPGGGGGGTWPTNIRGRAAGKSKKLPCPGVNFAKKIPCPGVKFS